MGSTGTGDTATAPLTTQHRGLEASKPNSEIRGTRREHWKLNCPSKAVPLAGTHMHTRAGRDPELPEQTCGLAPRPRVGKRRGKTLSPAIAGCRRLYKPRWQWSHHQPQYPSAHCQSIGLDKYPGPKRKAGIKNKPSSSVHAAYTGSC